MMVKWSSLKQLTTCSWNNLAEIGDTEGDVRRMYIWKFLTSRMSIVFTASPADYFTRKAAAHVHPEKKTGSRGQRIVQNVFFGSWVGVLRLRIFPILRSCHAQSRLPQSQANCPLCLFPEQECFTQMTFTIRLPQWQCHELQGQMGVFTEPKKHTETHRHTGTQRHTHAHTHTHTP